MKLLIFVLTLVFTSNLYSQSPLDIISTLGDEIYLTNSLEIGDNVSVGATTLGDKSHFIIIHSELPLDEVLVSIIVRIDGKPVVIDVNHENTNRVMFILSSPDCKDPEIKRAGDKAEVPVVIGRVIRGFWVNIYNTSTNTHKKIWVSKSEEVHNLLQTLSLIKYSYYGQEKKTTLSKSRRT